MIRLICSFSEYGKLYAARRFGQWKYEKADDIWWLFACRFSLFCFIWYCMKAEQAFSKRWPCHWATLILLFYITLLLKKNLGISNFRRQLNMSLVAYIENGVIWMNGNIFKVFLETFPFFSCKPFFNCRHLFFLSIYFRVRMPCHFMQMVYTVLYTIRRTCMNRPCVFIPGLTRLLCHWGH